MKRKESKGIVFALAILVLTCISHTGSAGNGAILKVRSDVDGSLFSNSGIRVKGSIGNLIAVDAPETSYAGIASTRGVASMVRDRATRVTARPDLQTLRQKYNGTDAVVGVLDNTVSTEGMGLGHFLKLERSGNVGFVSYRSDDPGSTVIIHSLKGNESDLMQSLAYMQAYAKAVGRPLMVELNLAPGTSSNPLFAQACQYVAEHEGVSMVCNSLLRSPMIPSYGKNQMAVAMFHPETGQVTDRSPFWAAGEAAGLHLQLLGSDGRNCDLQFVEDTEGYTHQVRNRSTDILIVQVLDAEGRMHYFHLKGNHPELRIRDTPLRIPVLRSGKDDILPFHTRSALLTETGDNTPLIDILPGSLPTTLFHDAGSELRASSTTAGHLNLELTGSLGKGTMRLTDLDGKVIYQCPINIETSSLTTRIDLSSNPKGIYRLSLDSIWTGRHFNLRM